MGKKKARTKNATVRGNPPSPNGLVPTVAEEEATNSLMLMTESHLERVDNVWKEIEEENREWEEGESRREKANNIEQDEGEGDSEKTVTQSSSPTVHATEDDDECGPMAPLSMYFGASKYVLTMKLSSKCYIFEAVELLESLLNPVEKKYFYTHPQFRHFFHMPLHKNHKVMGMWTLLVRTARLEKKKECWFIVNGTPVRYSLEEHALLSGLYCHPYPKDYDQAGSMDFVAKHFRFGSTITYKDVELKIKSMKKYSKDRLQMAVLYFLSSVIIGKRKTGDGSPCVEAFFQRAVYDLELCKTFPWGRMAFDANMDDIFHCMEKFDGNIPFKPQWVFPSFSQSLELLAFEAIPELKNHFTEPQVDVDDECPRMCKIKFKRGPKKGFSLQEIYDKLGTTQVIQSILVPSVREKRLLARILKKERRETDHPDVVSDKWTQLLSKGKTIWFEKMYEEDVANRKVVPWGAEKSGEIVAKNKGGRKPKNVKNVAEENLDTEKRLSEKMQELQGEFRKSMDDTFKEMLSLFNQWVDKLDEMKDKITDLDRRVTSLENSKRDGEDASTEEDDVSKKDGAETEKYDGIEDAATEKDGAETKKDDGIEDAATEKDGAAEGLGEDKGSEKEDGMETEQNIEDNVEVGGEDKGSEEEEAMETEDNVQAASLEDDKAEETGEVKESEKEDAITEKDRGDEAAILEAIVADGTAKENAIESKAKEDGDDRSDEDANKKKRKEQEGPNKAEEKKKKKQKVEASNRGERSRVMTRIYKRIKEEHEQKKQQQKKKD